MPKKQESASQLCAVLGEGCRLYTTEKQGKEYIRICGEEYLVTGYISAKHSGIYDSTILLFDGQLGEKTKEAIDYYALTMGITLILRSNMFDVQQQYENITEKLEENEIQTIIMDEYNPWYSTEVTSVNYRMFAYLTYLFSICIIVMVVEFWILQRRTELAIRRLDGYTSRQIIRMIAAEIVKIIGIITIVLTVLQMVLCILNGDGLDALEVSKQLVTILSFTVCTFILLMIYPVVVITRGSIAEAIQEGGRVR